LGRRWYNCTAEYWQRRPRARCSANREPRPKASSAWEARGSQTLSQPRVRRRLLGFAVGPAYNRPATCKDFTRCCTMSVTIIQLRKQGALEEIIPYRYTASLRLGRKHRHERITDHSKQQARVRVYTSFRLRRTTCTCTRRAIKCVDE
jgi:hypothetical protein